MCQSGVRMNLHWQVFEFNPDLLWIVGPELPQKPCSLGTQGTLKITVPGDSYGRRFRSTGRSATFQQAAWLGCLLLNADGRRCNSCTVVSGSQFCFHHGSVLCHRPRTHYTFAVHKEGGSAGHPQPRSFSLVLINDRLESVAVQVND